MPGRSRRSEPALSHGGKRRRGGRLGIESGVEAVDDEGLYGNTELAEMLSDETDPRRWNPGGVRQPA